MTLWLASLHCAEILGSFVEFACSLVLAWQINSMLVGPPHSELNCRAVCGVGQIPFMSVQAQHCRCNRHVDPPKTMMVQFYLLSLRKSSPIPSNLNLREDATTCFLCRTSTLLRLVGKKQTNEQRQPAWLLKCLFSCMFFQFIYFPVFNFTLMGWFGKKQTKNKQITVLVFFLVLVALMLK